GLRISAFGFCPRIPHSHTSRNSRMSFPTYSLADSPCVSIEVLRASIARITPVCKVCENPKPFNPLRYWRPVMTHSIKLSFVPLYAPVRLLTPGITPPAAAGAPPPTATTPEPAKRSNVEESQALVLLRGLPTLGTKHSVAIVELNPEAKNFGAILQES